jgi:hypothetical protein
MERTVAPRVAIVMLLHFSLFVSNLEESPLGGAERAGWAIANRTNGTKLALLRFVTQPAP